MRKPKVTPPEQAAEPVTQEDPTLAVSLSREDWNNVLASMEVGIKTIGFSAFEQGGKLMREISEQVEHGHT